ncbi:MAG: hypothetical protein ACJAUL_003161, partial [Paraglaciecola sp.]
MGGHFFLGLQSKAAAAGDGLRPEMLKSSGF